MAVRCPSGRLAAKDWSFEMYNEKTRNASPFARSLMQNGGAAGLRTPTQNGGAASHRTPSRDIPPEDRLDSTQPRLDMTEPRRRCDGSLRNFSPDNSDVGFSRGLGGLARNSHCQPSPSNCARGVCGDWGLESRPLAMVYSPCQAWRDAYPPEVALSRGTLFSELDLPFEGSKNKRGCSL